VTDDAPDDLIENAIEVHASGSSFGTNDYILFYANGPVKWEPNANNASFIHTQNYYENKSYYFLNFDQGPGKRIVTAAQVSGSPSLILNEFDAYTVVEQDTINIAGTGKL